MRTYEPYDWKSLMKIRDALQVLKDEVMDNTREWLIFDEELSFISEEIDRRYKKQEG
jgi:hypothetical protein